MQVEHYEQREQAFIKHLILRTYLQALAYKVGHFRPHTTLNYVDGFSGPWDAVHPQWQDSSPYIAASELVRARDRVRERVPMEVRAMFVEQDAVSFSRLEKLCAGLGELETDPRHGRFEDLVTEAVEFARTGSNPFAFVFIDPTGWTGYGLKRITPLLRVSPGEVLINFMTAFIMRFVDHPDPKIMPSFVDLFGDEAYREEWAGLAGIDREEAVVGTYCKRVLEAGGFRYAVSTTILDPRSDRTHYHLVYATRSDEGLVTFREIEGKALPKQKSLRAQARQRARETATGQSALFEPELLDTDFMTGLIERYRTRAEDAMTAILRTRGELSYDELVLKALQHPMTSEKEVKAWIEDRRRNGQLEVLGLRPRARVPQRKAGHRVRWVGARS